MLTGQNIVCFAKDYSEDPTSNNHVMRVLAQNNRVLWVNSLAMRTPSLASGSDLKKIGAKLRGFAKDAVAGAERVADNLWVTTPIVLPFPYRSWAQRANRHNLRHTLRRIRKSLGMDTFQLWTFLPTSVAYVGGLGESLVVFYITDEFSQFSYLDADRIAAMGQELCSRADVVFCTAHSLQAAKAPYNPHTYLASHGVDHAHFATAVTPGPHAPDLATLPRPIIGFFGLIQDWIDLDLIGFLARERPQWSFVLIGSAKVDVTALQAHPNVHLLGRRPYADLPAYCRDFAVGLIPFVINELTRHVNPIKLREYLSAGLPVVSTPLPEVAYYRDSCAIAADPPAFLSALDSAVAEDSPEKRLARSRAMAGETWEKKVDEIGRHVRDAMARKTRAPRA
jgi:glycosyltransferase involved in cell wall biosynthesis